MARAVKEEPEAGRRKKKKAGAGTVLNRLVIVSLLCGCAYLYGQTIHLNTELAQAQTELAAAPRQDSPAPIRSARTSLRTPRGADYLAEAQTHTQRAEQALANGNIGDAWRESHAASDDARAASQEASAQTQKTLTQIRGRLDSVQERASKLWRNVGG